MKHLIQLETIGREKYIIFIEDIQYIKSVTSYKERWDEESRFPCIEKVEKNAFVKTSSIEISLKESAEELGERIKKILNE